jgi:hypothetical protein
MRCELAVSLAHSLLAGISHAQVIIKPPPEPRNYVQITAKNPKVRNYLLDGSSGTPDEAHEREVARLLNDPDPGVRQLVATHVAETHNEPGRAPKAIDLLRKRVVVKEYPNLDDSVNYGKKKYGVSGS